MTVRTACASSLTALHNACLAIQKGECAGAIVVGSSLILDPQMTLVLSSQGVLAPDGRCKSFDAGADGYARGEGIVALHVKRLTDAMNDNDPIRAVIRSSCVNSSGRSTGLAQPSAKSQETLIRRSHTLAGITDVSKTAMVECHGTGTPVGDPVEARAVASVFGEHGIYIGSVRALSKRS